ncbi:MAG: hypothetical protein ACON4V_06745 [Parvibaculales bacterium]
MSQTTINGTSAPAKGTEKKMNADSASASGCISRLTVSSMFCAAAGKGRKEKSGSKNKKDRGKISSGFRETKAKANAGAVIKQICTQKPSSGDAENSLGTQYL